MKCIFLYDKRRIIAPFYINYKKKDLSVLKIFLDFHFFTGPFFNLIMYLNILYLVVIQNLCLWVQYQR